VALAALGVVSAPVALAILAALIGLTSLTASITNNNLLSWHSAVLPDQDRRLVVPRLMAVSLGIGALLLLPMAVLLDTLVHAIGLYAYALPFVVSGALGLAELWVLFRLRHPGQVIVPPAAQTAESEPTPDLNRFLRSSGINALGMGITPAFSVFIISVLGMTAGFSMICGAIGTLTMVAAAAFYGDRLTRGSSSRMLRNSFAIRCGAMTSMVLTWPLPFLAPVLVIVASMLGAIGFASGQLAANERLFRLISGPAVIRHHARYLARTSGAMTIGQLFSAGVIAVTGPVGGAFVGLYGASAAIRVVAFREAMDPAPSTVPPPDAGEAAIETPAGQLVPAESPAPAVGSVSPTP